MISPHTFSSGTPGPHILFLGAIHGNETCGPEAIQQIIEELGSGHIKLLSGLVTFVPISNKEAYEKKVRYIDEDLNRVFQKNASPQTHEQRIANELTSLVDKCDVMLDIHSTLAGGPVNIFIDFLTDDNRDFAKALNAQYAILGWPSLYEKSGQQLLSSDTTVYANKIGKTCLLIECGQHEDPGAVPVAYQAIIDTLAHFKLIADTAGSPAKGTAMKEITMTELFVKNAEGDHFTHEFKHLDKIATGEVIATRETGEEIVAKSNGVMVLPKLNGQVGKEWFYLGQ